jgi:tight adherence protein B
VTVEVIVAILLIVGFILVLGINVKYFLKDIKKSLKKPMNIKKMCRTADGKGGNFITHKFKELHKILSLMNREEDYERYVYISIGVATAGAVVSAAVNNLFLLPVLSLFCLFIPLLFAFITSKSYTQKINNELQTSMSIVTSTYERTQNLLTAVSENIDYLHEPCKSVFSGFLGECEFMTSNVEKAINHMKNLVSNDIWKEWCEALILCQHDRANIAMLDPIITKMRNVDAVQIDLNEILYKPVRDFVLMIALVLINFPILFFLNRDWWNYLIFTVPGKFAIAITFAVLLYSIFAVMRAIKPIDYKR